MFGPKSIPSSCDVVEFLERSCKWWKRNGKAGGLHLDALEQEIRELRIIRRLGDQRAIHESGVYYFYSPAMGISNPPTAPE